MTTVGVDVVHALWRGFLGFYSSNDLTHASSIAYFSLLSLFPGVMLMLSLLGHLTASEDDRTAVVSFFLRDFPTQFGFLTSQLDALRGQRVTLGLAGGLLTAWAALGVFGAITTAMNSAWKVERQPSYLKHKLVSSLMMVAAGILTFVGLAVVSAQNVINASWFAAVLQNSPGSGGLDGVLRELGDADAVRRRDGADLLLRAEHARAVPRRLVRGDPHRRAVAPGACRFLVVRARPVAVLDPRVDLGGRRVPDLDLSLGRDPDVRRGVHCRRIRSSGRAARASERAAAQARSMPCRPRSRTFGLRPAQREGAATAPRQALAGPAVECGRFRRGRRRRGPRLAAGAVYVVRTRPGSPRADAAARGVFAGSRDLRGPARVGARTRADDAGWLRDGLPEIVASELTTNPDIRIVAAVDGPRGLVARGAWRTRPQVPRRRRRWSIARELRAERFVTSELRRDGRPVRRSRRRCWTSAPAAWCTKPLRKRPGVTN